MITARIKSISEFGEVVIQFSEDMNWDSFNWTNINDTVFDIYINYTREWFDNDFRSTDFEMTRINFTWTIMNTTNDKMFIQLDFNDPFAVSTQSR